MMFTPLMGSLGRRDGDSLGKKVFLESHSEKLHSNRRGGAPSGAATFIVFSGMRASTPMVKFSQYMHYPQKTAMSQILQLLFTTPHAISSCGVDSRQISKFS
jgi:hypothetical protein